MKRSIIACLIFCIASASLIMGCEEKKSRLLGKDCYKNECYDAETLAECDLKTSLSYAVDCDYGCINDACNEAPASQPEQTGCTAGETKCTGSYALTCKSDGSSFDAEQCQYGCNNGRCNPPVTGWTCTAGVQICSGINIIKCKSDNSGWETVQTCQNGCEYGKCKTDDGSNNDDTDYAGKPCTYDKPRICSGGLLYICSESDMKFGKGGPCPDGTVCKDGYCEDVTPSDGGESSATGECNDKNANKWKCEGKNYYQCNAETHQWVSGGACETECANQLYSCIESMPCENGKFVCSGDILHYCKGGLNPRYFVKYCNNGCSNGQCIGEQLEFCEKAQSLDHTCKGSDVYRCLGLGNEVYVWLKAYTCPAGCKDDICIGIDESCNSSMPDKCVGDDLYTCDLSTMKYTVKKKNGCGTTKCKPNTSWCFYNTVRHCASDGTWQDPTEYCSISKGCLNGKCL